MAQSHLATAIRAGDDGKIWIELDYAQRGYLPGWPSTLSQIARDEALRLIENGILAVRVALANHPDGRVREAAIATFQPDEGATLDALLQRANDWVPVVAKLAASRAMLVLRQASDEELKRVVPRVHALTRQGRVDHRTLINEFLREVCGRPGLSRKIRRAYGSGPVGV